MNFNYYIWFIFFGIIIYLIVVDKNIADYFVLLLKLGKLKYEKLKWMILNDPRNPIVKWLMWRNALRIAKELEKELNK
tara:strand:+ start:4256 stop:4489 length:234 start_codon:yes stop_codon:yes gene_type:complete